MKEFNGFLVDLHVFSERDRCSLGPSDEMAPAPRLAGRIELLDDRLMVLEGVHLGEIIVARDLS